MKWEAIKNAIVVCDRGTGYLVAPDLVVTCEQVMENKAIGATAWYDDTLWESLCTLRESIGALRESGCTLWKSICTLRKPADTLRKRVRTLRKPIFTLRKPIFTLQEPILPGRRLAPSRAAGCTNHFSGVPQSLC